MALTEIKKHISTDKVLDLYAGVGTIGLSVARDRHLTLVEVDKSAYRELVNNASEHGTITSSERSLAPVVTGLGRSVNDPSSFMLLRSNNAILRTVLARSEDALEYIDFDQTVILDPPRSGCDRKLIDKLIEVKPPKIIYLSCNPATQARDIALLLEKYHIDEVKTFNFFPHTPHIENLVILSL